MPPPVTACCLYSLLFTLYSYVARFYASAKTSASKPAPSRLVHDGSAHRLPTGVQLLPERPRGTPNSKARVMCVNVVGVA